MNLVFIGPPYAGKGTQTDLLSKELNIPFFSMGALIRQAYKKKDPRAIEGFEKYSLEGKHVPIHLKFPFLEERLNTSKEGFILDNFPATEEDLQVFNRYLEKHQKKVDKAIYVKVSKEEMHKRMQSRGRKDDNPEIVEIRRENQDKDRIPVIDFYKSQGILEEINGEKDINEVHKEIIDRLGIKFGNP